STAFTCYVKHVITTTALPVPVLITSLILVSRLKQRRPDLRGEAGSECRIFIAALAIAMKLLMDNTFSARTWEKVASIPVADLNVMEMEFLGQIDFETHVGEAEYFTWL
ncbi:uncharacterized protein EV422DRAFT_478142, partial [Fimicolochytrium jonesii]|uniref:uncharacterized protein n=1 Tax=Fimicolochytrium jonesii TaxID=1396493 RepID=UPI0022FE5252